MKLLYPEFLILLFGPIWLYLYYNFTKVQKFLIVALSFIILALTRPVMVQQQVTQKMPALEATIALDLSLSMQATDIKPNRFKAASQIIKTMLAQNQTDRFALYGFTTQALILSPATHDHTLLQTSLDSIKIDNILTHGTNIKQLLQTLIQHNLAMQTIIIFSDGGDENDINTLLTLCKKYNIRIIAAGMATKRGSSLQDNYAHKIKDTQGALVISRLNPLLERLAIQSGGVYIPYQSIQQSVKAIQKALSLKAYTQTFVHIQKSHRELFWIPLLIAIIFILLAFIQLPKKILVLLPFITQQSDALFLDWYYISKAKQTYENQAYEQSYNYLQKISRQTLQSTLHKAHILYKIGAFRDAIALIEPLQTNNSMLKKQIYALLGNCYAQRKQYNKAKYYYQKALILKKDPDILYNLKCIAFQRTHQQPKPPAYKRSAEQAKNSVAQKERKKSPQTEKSGQTNKQKTKLSRPLGYKAYELINKGYINEKKPW